MDVVTRARGLAMAEESGTDAGDGERTLHTLGGYIRLQRQLADLSLRQLAEMTKVSNAYLSQIERGMHQPSLRVLRSIADALDLSADTLLAQAGLLGTATGQSGQGRTGSVRTETEAAILADPELSPDDREALLRVYRSLRQRRRDP
jgi:transcriptional regulator with XRE-family HTH domain